MSKSSQKTSAPCTPQKPPHPPVVRNCLFHLGSLLTCLQPNSLDIIVYEHVELQSNEDVDAVAKETLRRAIGSAGPGAAGKSMIYGNQAGRGILEVVKRLEGLVVNSQTEIAGLRAQIGNLQTQIGNFQVESADNRAEIANLQDCVQSLTQEAKGYRRIRHRFINVYRRDVLEEKVDDGRRERIDEGNRAAHRGDAITDATLYTTEEREDQYDLIHIYGLTADQISLLSKCLTS